MISTEQKNQLLKDISLLNKEKLVQVLSADKKLLKNELVTLVYNKIKNDAIAINKFYNENKDELAMKPGEVEDFLSISKRERLNWTNQGKLSIIRKEIIIKWRKEIEIPLFDRELIYQINQELIASWRTKQREELKNKKQESIKKGIETKRERKVKRNEFYNNLLSEFENWNAVDKDLAITLQLAFWTTWINRWAKEYELKAMKTDDYRLEHQYNSRSEYLYELKNKAIQVLSNRKGVELSFYEPTNPHKTTVYLCDEHHKMWLSGFREMTKWDYIKENSEIEECEDCYHDREIHYYSLFYVNITSVQLDGIDFSFHLPYQHGQEFMPSIDMLPRVVHKENNEGMFRFGRTISLEEKVVYTEKKVLKEFGEIIEQINASDS